MYVLYSLLTMFTICLTICILDKSNYLWFDDCIWSKSRWGRILYYKACLIKYINYSTNNTLSPKIYLTQSKPSRLRKCIVIHIHLSANYCHHKKFRSENLNIHSVTNRRGLSSFKHDVSNTFESDTKLNIQNIPRILARRLEHAHCHAVSNSIERYKSQRN